MSITSPTLAKGTEIGADPCREIITACDEALSARKKELQLCDLGLKQSLDTNASLRQDVQDRDAKLGAIWRNPWLYLALGIAAGVVIAK